LAPHEVAATRDVLRRYGNLSSATIFIVLDEIRKRFQQEAFTVQPLTGVAMAFGPGLVIEMARLTYLPAPSQQFHPCEISSHDRVTSA
jgi:predicted naringenin-chalcone synthase